MMSATTACCAGVSSRSCSANKSSSESRESFGALYATGFLLFPGRTLALFFAYDFDDALRPFLHLAVRMVAINHYGYVAGLLAAPPERAIRVATGFLVLGGAVIVYAGQLWLDTAPAYWSCTALTTAMIGAHVIVL